MSEDQIVYCRSCEQHHGARWLCDSSKALIDAIIEKANSYELEPIKFDDPIMADADQVADVLMRSVTINAGAADVAGIARPLVILSGLDQYGKPLPRWLYIASIQDLQRTRDLFSRMVSIAIEEARRRRAG